MVTRVLNIVLAHRLILQFLAYFVLVGQLKIEVTLVNSIFSTEARQGD